MKAIHRFQARLLAFRQRTNPNIAPAHFVGAAIVHTVDLEGDESMRVSFVGFLVRHFIDKRAVDPRTEPWALRYDTQLIL